LGGRLSVKQEDVQQIIRLFSDQDGEGVVRTHFGGTEVGCVVTERVRGLDPELTLISEYGEPVKVRRIRQYAGFASKVVP